MWAAGYVLGTGCEDDFIFINQANLHHLVAEMSLYERWYFREQDTRIEDRGSGMAYLAEQFQLMRAPLF